MPDSNRPARISPKPSFRSPGAIGSPFVMRLQPEGISRKSTLALRLALGYSLVGLSWILFSNRVLTLLVTNPQLLQHLQVLRDALFVFITAFTLFLLVQHYLGALQDKERALQELAAGTAGTTGEDFFQLLVRHLASALGTSSAFIGELTDTPEPSIRTVAAWLKGRDSDNFQYTLAGSPCEKVVGQKICFYPEKVQELFPGDQGLSQLGVNSYLGAPLCDSRGNPLGLLVVMDEHPLRDGTQAETLLRIFAERAAAELERVRSREALQNNFDQISTIFGALSAVVYVADLDSYEMLYLNDHGEEVFGKNWRGKRCYRVLQGGKDKPCSFCTNDQLVRSEKIQPPVLWELCNTRNGRWYQCIDRAIRWPDGRLVRLEIAIDITERKEMDRIKDELLSSVSHELRTPLTAILGYAEFLLENPLPADQQQPHLQVLYQEAERLNDLIGNFLQLQRLKSRREGYHFQPLPAQELLERAIDYLRTLSSCHSPVLEVAPGLPPLRGDLEAIDQVLENLTRNAVKYSPEGGRVVLGARQQGERIVLTVQDEGIGIPAVNLERIFDPLYRIDNSDRRRTSGAGLGLTLVREIVSRHNGRVWAESAPDQGSTFSVELPVMKEFAGVAPDDQH